VKVLRSIDTNRSSKDRENFITEALILKRYKHKRIVNCIGIAAYREPLMIVMEIVERMLNIQRNRNILFDLFYRRKFE